MMLRSLCAALSALILGSTAIPAAAEIWTVDFKGIGRVSNTIMTCYDADENGTEVCPAISEYGLPPVGSVLAFNGRFTAAYFPVPETGFTSGFVDLGNLNFSVTPVSGPGTRSFFSDVINGEMEFLNGRVTAIDTLLGDDYCSGQGNFTWNSAAPASGRFGFFFCGFEDGFDQPLYGYEADWRLTATSINGGAWTTVPEPQTWALLVIGFGGIGAAMRRQAVRPAIARG